MKNFNIFYILCIFYELIVKIETYYFTTNCSKYCLCDLTASILTITCAEYNPSFIIPNLANINIVTALIIDDNYLNDFPANMCQFEINLHVLDISLNYINANISDKTFDCLTQLEFLNVSRNQIENIDKNAFENLNKLLVLDLSYNKISFIPDWYEKFKNLKYLFLNNNYLNNIDISFFFLNSIIKIDLTHNNIYKFTNGIGTGLYNKNMGKSKENAELIDLRYNSITSFDDRILYLFYINELTDFKIFFKLINSIHIDQNPIECSCSSFNLLVFYQFLLNSSEIIDTSSNILKATCSSPIEYYGKNIFSFTNYKNCRNFVLT
jgi:hypothetical protein